ncbi:putative tyrosine/dopa decarboxylase putativedopa decarboxylase [Leptomonas pyrrhocoris]|uniref:Putative tyrosine/dopa decarboxylase putativedopa decarboxylase n=1 Tax=Leptomonas pyrrhocoris TaxID=157538 RepID=A0A0N0VGH2_LEPPY|nr:putative tyrosine/dopa decarboxylase putativedopa decarboxylase [Leptomonas pyrrhocoris]KPA83314.1 putative tyrosine/dopa decarboxylase putativedopa decarboxylase [Leptomonas pyrrhocoris]|eukprot:XP_015661753.1 putative tyrosine/dopa decarboxylase putativedopa decarboxylase [Leptomonas pyrrhocoris]
MKPTCPPLPPIPATMDWERFREEGHRVIDFIADYHLALKNREMPAQSAVKPGYLKKAISDRTAPQTPQSNFTGILADIQKNIVPGMTHWQHPDFYAWFPAQVSPAALLGDTVASGFNQPGFNWMASPAAAELETIVTDWLARAFGLPAEMTWESTGGGVLQPTASEAVVVALLAAKNRTLEKFATPAEKATASAKLVCYISDQAHFCVEKASRILSFWHLRKVRSRRDAHGNCPMHGDDLRAAVAADVAAGLIPCFASMNYGTTGVCATDDFEGIAKVCADYGIWLNLDSAYAGATAVCPEMRAPLLPAFAHADSIFINGSKWFSLMTNCSFFFFRDRRYIVSSLNATGVYLSNKYTEADAVIDFKDYQLGMGRPFRALKVYTTLQYMGLEGIQATIRRHCALAKYLHDLLAQCGGEMLEFPVEAKFGLVCFRIREDDAANKRNHTMLETMEEERRAMIVHHELDGKVIIRVVLAYPGLTEKDMEDLADYLTVKAKETISSIPL